MQELGDAIVEQVKNSQLRRRKLLIDISHKVEDEKLIISLSFISPFLPIFGYVPDQYFFDIMNQARLTIPYREEDRQLDVKMKFVNSNGKSIQQHYILDRKEIVGKIDYYNDTKLKKLDSDKYNIEAEIELEKCKSKPTKWNVIVTITEN
jgi:hypothetical protein